MDMLQQTVARLKDYDLLVAVVVFVVVFVLFVALLARPGVER